MIKKLFFLLFSFLTPLSLLSQNTVLDANPTSVKWDRIVTSYFNIVFPVGTEDLAQKTANLLETVYEPGAISMNKFPKKTSIILQNQSTISNGFVAWTPYRSEFNTFPSQNYFFQGNNDWMELLSFHEYRHMVQIQKSKVGFNKFISILFGQATTANLANYAAPKWFWEGDATIMETALTSSGRGRIPDFSRLMRSNLLEKKPFTYNKQYLGSFKDFVPNEYVTGYFFGGYLRREFGADILAKVTKQSWSWSFVPFTFSNALKKHSGKYLVKNYKDFVQSQKSTWQKQINTLEVESYHSINKRKNKVVTSYRYPHIMPSGKILALKSGMGDISQFVQIDEDGNEEKIVTPGFINGAGRISYNGNQIVWNEFTPDPRWTTRIHSDIKLYDFENDKIVKKSEKSRYASSAISPNGKLLVSIYSSMKGVNKIIVSDINSNKSLYEYQYSNNHHITPEWSSDSKGFYVIEIENRNKKIVKYTLEADPSRKVIYEAGSENISYPKIYGNHLFYQSPYNGIDNIYVIDLTTNEHYQVTNATYGAYFPNFDQKTSALYFSDHQEFGLNIAKKEIDFAHLTPKTKVPVYKDPLPAILTAQEPGVIKPKDITNHAYPIEKFPKTKGIINPHSWGAYMGANLNEIQFFVSSTDIRNTTQINAGYAYNVNEQHGRWEAEASYHGLFPIIGLSYTDARRGFSEEILDTTRSFSWDEKGVQLGLTIPIQLTTSKYQRALVFRGRGGMYQVKGFPPYPFNNIEKYITNGNLYSMKLDATFRRLLKTSQRDLYSKWGQSMNIFLYGTPFGGNYQSTLIALEGTFYFPGLAKHHSLYIRPGYQYENKVNYNFSSPILFPRGYTYTSYDHFYKVSANYSLPLFYPDFGIGPLLYIQRVKANLFYDLGKGTLDSPYDFITKEKVYKSLGLEVNFDFNIMRYKSLLDLGFRINYLPEDQSFSYNILIGTLGF